MIEPGNGGCFNLGQHKSLYRSILFILGVGLVFRLFLATIIPPGFDEAYYGVFSFFPSWGYYDHPPAVSIIAGIGCWLSGSHSWLALRLGSILLFLLTSLILFQLTRQIFNEIAALYSLIMLHLTPFFFFWNGCLCNT